MIKHPTLQVLEMLPTVNCVKPKICLSFMTCNEADSKTRVMDTKEFKSETFQRVYQYLSGHAYNKDTVEGIPRECLDMLLK